MQQDPFKNIQSGEDWLKERTKGIGGSEIGCVAGTNPWKNKYELWEEKTNKKLPQDLSNNYAVQRGKSHEPVARAFAEEKYNTKFPPVNLSHKEFPFLRCSLDGYSNDLNMVLEIKVPMSIGHSGEIPKNYYDQMQWGMLMTGATKALYMEYDPDGISTRYEIVERDDKRIKLLMTLAIDFWNNHVLKDVPPVSFEVGEDALIDDCEELKAAHKALEFAEERYEKIKDKFVERLSMSSTKELTHYGVSVSKTTRKGNVDYSKIPVLKGMNLDQYRKADVEVVSIKII